MDSLPLTEARAQLSSLVERVIATHDRVQITRRGRAAAVLVSQDDLDSLEETLDVLSDAAALSGIAQARAELALGEGLTVPEVRELLASRGKPS